MDKTSGPQEGIFTVYKDSFILLPAILYRSVLWPFSCLFSTLTIYLRLSARLYAFDISLSLYNFRFIHLASCVLMSLPQRLPLWLP